MNQEIYQKFKAYDFHTSRAWQEYYKNIYPTPAMNMYEKLKRKWYKANIEPAFDIEFDESTFSQQNSQQNPQQNTHQNNQNCNHQFRPTPNTQIKNVGLYKFEGMLKMLFFFAVFFSGNIAKCMVSTVCMLALYRSYGRPEFSKKYAAQIMPSEFFGNLIYLLAVSVNPSQNSFLIFLPLAIHMLSGVATFCSSFDLLDNIKYFDQYKQQAKLSMEVIRMNRNLLIISKAKIEIILLFYFILNCLFGFTSLIQVFMYIQFLGNKNRLNSNMMIAQEEVKQTIFSYINRPGVPKPLRYVVEKMHGGYMKVLNLVAGAGIN